MTGTICYQNSYFPPESPCIVWIDRMFIE